MIKSIIRNWLEIPDVDNAKKQIKALSIKQGNGLYRRFAAIIHDDTGIAKADARVALDEMLVMQEKLDFLKG